MACPGGREEPGVLSKALLTAPFKNLLMNPGCRKRFLPANLYAWLQVLVVFSFTDPAMTQDSLTDTLDYPAIFGKDYQFAVGLIEQEAWMADTLLGHGLDPDFALSIVFPELIRYSSIIDYAQLTGLEVLYVQYGTGYADFSVGWFQMKPSFAERIEADLLRNRLEDSFPSLSHLRPDTSSSADSRRERLLRLKDPYFQLLYLEAFIRIVDDKYSSLMCDSESGRLAFYATAYNTGYFKNESVIREEMKKKRFYKGMDATPERYSYADISLSYYLSLKE
jgi:hypothetical protein